MTSLFRNSRLVLGTVQLGQPYGIANKSGKPDQALAEAIVQCAWEGGIRFFDTARSYGESEAVLGSAFRALGTENEVRVISKLTADWKGGGMRRQMESSLAALRIPSLYACLLHREEDLPFLLDGLLGEEAEACIRSDRTGKFGISVYTPDAALAALRHPLVSIVQLPASVFDRRFEAAGVFDLARRLGKEIHIRSALLQGVLCLTPEELPANLSALAPPLRRWRAFCLECGCEPAPLALAWLARRYPETHILFGAETLGQVTANIALFAKAATIPATLWHEIDITVFPAQQDTLLNPSLWNKSHGYS